MNIKLLRIIVAAVLLGVASVVEHTMNLTAWQLLLVYLVPYLIVGYDVLLEAAEGIRDREPFNENLLMVIATLGALGIGFMPDAEPEYREAVFVMLFFQVGELFEDYAEDRSRRSITGLMNIRPDRANVERGGEVVVVSPETVAVGETIVVKPGEKIPMDGKVTEGTSNLDTVALTGESRPRACGVGDAVQSGCVNLSGVLKICVEKTFGESTASKIIELVENAGESKSESESFVRKFAKVYTPIVVAIAVIVAFIPPLFAESYGAAFSTWLYRALTFLVVSCPCALVISIPLTFFAGIGGASRKGILVKGGNYLEALAKASDVVFDKTGTLTKGVFDVNTVHNGECKAVADDTLLHLAAHVERFSTHPIGAALRRAFPHEHDGCNVEDIHEVAGKGISARINGRQVAVGNEKMMESIGAEWHHCSKTGTIIHVAVEGKYAGHVVIADTLKPDAAAAIGALKKLGVGRAMMLTGDQEEVAEAVAAELGLDEYHAALLPADKVKHIERLKSETQGSLVFVGDGINDAPVLARADVGVAMGGLGADAAIEAADVVLMDDQLSKMPLAIRIARHTLSIARQNVVFAIGVKVLVLLLASFGIAGMGLAVFADVGVMVLAVLNAMRALYVKG